MTQYKVCQRFLDKPTGKVYEVGELYPATSSAERLEHLLATDSPHRDAALVGKPILEKLEDELVNEPTKPTEKSTIKAIKEYLTENEITFDNHATKAALLELVE